MSCRAYDYSFIVPVYNAEAYIEETIQSILRQGEQCELILVDDGSKDGSGEICDRYAKEYHRIKVYHRENGGPAAARNFGLEMASGAYCCFVDADDTVSDDLISHLACGDADVIFYRIVKVFSDGTQRPMAEGLKREKIYGRKKHEVLKEVAKCPKFPASTGGKIIKTDFLRKNHIRFAEGIIGEDIDWTLQLMTHMTAADVYEEGCYYYRIAQDGRHAYGKEKSLQDQLGIIENWLKKPMRPDERDCIPAFLAFQYAVTLPFYGALPRAIRKKYRTRIQGLRFLLSRGKTLKIRLIRLAVFLLGIDGASKILYRYVVKRDE